MLEPLKTLTNAESRAGADEFVCSLTEETRAAIKLDVRYALRDAGPNRARDFPLLTLLSHTMDRQLGRLRFPAHVLAKLAREIESVRAKLPDKSPLAELADNARRDLSNSAAADAAAALAAQATPPAAPAAPREEVHNLKSAAAQVEVTYMTTMELGDNALAGYLKYCLGVGEYDKIIEALRPRATKAPRVWVWSLLTTAMRLSEHPDFEVTANAFHAWLAAVHPETITSSKDERRRFSVEKIAALEEQELVQR